MQLLGAEVVPVDFGTRTLKEATSEAIRDWITNVETTHYLIGSCVGPHPYPEIVRELQAVIGREAREQLLEAEGRTPEVVVACVGGGSNAIGMFSGFMDDAEVRLVGVEAAGAASLGTGRPGVLHGTRSSVLADEDGQILDAHSISAGLDYPGVGPEHAFLRDTGRAEYVAATDAEALAAFRRLAETEGIIPALEPSQSWTRTWCSSVSRAAATRTWPKPSRLWKPDEPSATAPPIPPPREGAEPLSPAVDDSSPPQTALCRFGAKSRASAMSKARKVLVVYLMAGPETPELAQAAVEGGADIVELGFPFSDPLADGPVIRRAAERALAQGMRTKTCLECLARANDLVDVPLVPMTYASLLEAYGWERFSADAAAAGAASMIVADLPAGERPELHRIQLVAPTSTDERISLVGELTDGWLYLVTVTGTTGTRSEVSPALAGLVSRARAATDRPLYAGFGISTTDHARAAAELADGIVVGSRAVEVAEEGPAALCSYVASLRAALDG